MTAIVCALNKQAVAIAADSAVTIGNTHKVLNSGNKIFRMSKYAPIGVAIYGTATYMGTPWEIIIKQYRKQINNTKYQEFKDYVNDFLNYIRYNDSFASDTIQKQFLREQLELFISSKITLSKRNSIFSSNQSRAFVCEIQNCLNSKSPSKIFNEDFKTYPCEEFAKDYNNLVREVIDGKALVITEEEFKTVVEAFYYWLIAPVNRYGETGLVFFGYGENELYPSMKDVKVCIGFKKRLVYQYGESVQISNEGTFASITPFAQPDVAHTIIRGVNPAFYELLSKSFSESVSGFKKVIADEMRKNSLLVDTAKVIENLDISNVTDSFVSSMQTEMRKLYTQPLVNTIGSLGVEDLANMVQSFVSLTSLVRRMSPAEETVGGPVDVAVISKGDGFIWIKRKLYFDSKINTHFFDNYYND